MRRTSSPQLNACVSLVFRYAEIRCHGKKDLLTSPIATDRSAVGLFSAFEAVAVFTVVVRVSGSRNMTHAVFLRRLQRFAGDVA